MALIVCELRKRSEGLFQAKNRLRMSSGDALVTRISSLLRDLPTLKAAVIVACAFTALLIACLLLRVFRSGKRLKKTRKYDIITTPAERVEMAPLNEEDDEDEDSTVFDIKYRSGKRLKKTRKYDIITTPAERVEMAPLNEEDDEDEDSTVFDIKYRENPAFPAVLWETQQKPVSKRYRITTKALSSAACASCGPGRTVPICPWTPRKTPPEAPDPLFLQFSLPHLCLTAFLPDSEDETQGACMTEPLTVLSKVKGFAFTRQGLLEERAFPSTIMSRAVGEGPPGAGISGATLIGTWEKLYVAVSDVQHASTLFACVLECQLCQHPIGSEDVLAADRREASFCSQGDRTGEADGSVSNTYEEAARMPGCRQDIICLLQEF
ncbi:Membrane protein FAM174B [Tupaia chinensis]|uniref:Membrane protein FAM174B n=2 Tax=Boreoeutheria TaxID=1437010 RepID=L9LAF3_TUPCH|nr:Membrane protein FAM174B [Tupaia chinensis]